MFFLEALKTLSNDGRQIEEKLRLLAEHSALGYQAVSNLYNESRLPKQAWQSLFEALQIAALDPAAIRQAVSESLRRWTLCGPDLSPPRPTRFGRAVTTDRFRALLRKLHRSNSDRSARQKVRAMLSWPRQKVARLWGNHELGQYLMWSTFNTATNDGDPFADMPDSADYIRGVLGLDRNERGKSLLLLEYALPANAMPRFPTVADAYAGDEWPYFFRPAPEGAPTGLTMPWPEYQDEAPRPEAVHEVVRVKHLTAPLQEVK